jgi:hypothetical protein
MFGAGIYFADSKYDAQHKSGHGSNVFITADVDMGRALVLESAARAMTLQTVRSYGCDSIKGRGGVRSGWEYIVFEAHRIRLISVEGKMPFIRPLPPVVKKKLVCTYTEYGPELIIQPYYHCLTCGLIGRFGCCYVCFELCHRGHNTFLEDFQKECSCDCGAGHWNHLGTSCDLVCTYAESGTMYIHQPWYHCKTCGLVGERGCCHACFIHCHNGHDVFMDDPQKVYCDCGASGNCKCMKP